MTPGPWRTIESAPQDGTPFLGYLGGLGVPYFVCWWGARVSNGEPYICVLGIGELYDFELFPTHWQPLPAAPTEGGE